MRDRVGVLLVLAWCLIFFAGGITAGYLLEKFNAEPSPSAAPSLREGIPPTSRSVPDTVPRPSARGPRVAIVIDDLGWDREPSAIYERIDQPLTMAVMPGRPHSQWFYDRWSDRFEFIVHMPMEPLGYPEDDPGKLALMTSMSSRDIQQRVRSVVQRYPRAVGFNNHMGSAFTQDRSGMNALMKELARQGLFYLDSQTTPSSVARAVGRKWGVPVVENQVFLDGNRTGRAIRDRLQDLVELARKQGYAIGIGHMQSTETARVLEQELPRYARQGIEFVPLSTLVNRRLARRNSSR